MSSGFVIVAENSEKVDYVSCAIACAQSLRSFGQSVSIITSSDIKESVFDEVIKPNSSNVKNDIFNVGVDMQVYDLSPYDRTFKVEADMYFPQDISYWWDSFACDDIKVCGTIRDLHGEISYDRTYRHFIDANNLPDVYNAITYFSKNERAKLFFNTIQEIVDNWDRIKSLLQCDPDERITTDWVYSLACNILGERSYYPKGIGPSFVHMKQNIIKSRQEDWTKCMVLEKNPVRINTFPQLYPVHYVVKDAYVKF